MNEEPDDLAVFQLQLQELMDRRRLSQARAVLHRALPRFPDDLRLLFYSAWVDLAEGDADAAHDTAQRMLELDPHSESGRALLADIYEARDEDDKAEMMYRSLLSDFPDDADYNAAYALLLVGGVHLTRAEQLSARAIELDPDNIDAMRAVVLVALRTGDRAVVDATLKTMLATDPETLGTAVSLAQVLRDRGQFDEAARIARELLSVSPDNPHLLDLVIELKHDSHWSMLPLRPFQRIGFEGGLAALALLGLGAWQMGGDAPVVRAIGMLALAYAAYGAAWPPLLKYLIRR